MDFKFEEPIRPDCKLADFLGQVVMFQAVGKPFKSTIPDSDTRPGFTSEAVLSKVVGYDTKTGAVKVGHTNLYPPGPRQEAMRCQPNFTKPGLLVKLPHQDADKAANGYTVWAIQALEPELLQAAIAAFRAA